jgi:ubiquinone/menaquinone biosynthesis C-methylase UbiE
MSRSIEAVTYAADPPLDIYPGGPMSKEAFQLSGNAASIYEEQKVPAIFAPLADATLAVVPLLDNDQVIDLACGTGIVARKVRQKIGKSASVVGVDLNEGMISTAAGLADESARSCEWRVADVTQLPFEDHSFTIAFCQQGIQFFPDIVAALVEMKRVLRPHGRAAISVWAGPSDFATALASSLRNHIGEEIAKQSLAPFAFGDIERLSDAMTKVGFQEITSQLLTIDRTIGSHDAIAEEIMASPVGPKVAEFGNEMMASIITEVSEALTKHRHGDGFVVPQTAGLIQANVG